MLDPVCGLELPKAAPAENAPNEFDAV